ncbi:protein of unknown function [Mesobacillus persicus]|uniref:Rv2525c-like glycoside hydrolase-like domain-containing protein n=1 Tax=Mesobacillus persicus TaxID=930146 RepID=A0A1H8CRN2_9BACI|nr:protein of unknown function [Mesobacillus persicus]
MGSNRILPLVITGFLAVMISICAFFLIGNNNSSEPTTGETSETEQKTTSNDKTNQGGTSGDSDITNNVENNVDGEEADINNSINNNLQNSSENQIDNSITNNVEVNVDVNVTNNISNNVEGQKDSNSSNDGDNSNNNNGDSNSGENGNSGDDSNGDNNDGNNNGNNNEDENTNQEEIIWGVDSASLTTEDMIACVEDNFGSPDIWGRYLGDKEGVSRGLTSDEIELLQSNDIRILVIWNHFENATGFDNGQSEAEEAIQMAQDLGVPEGVAIFADIEPNYPVDSEFIRGWFETMNESQYTPGFYGVFDPERDLYAAYEQAGADNGQLLENAYVWTAAPNNGITTEDNAPEYQPQAPENAQIGGWQYGLDAQACNIDTNLFNSELLDVLW